MAPVAFREHTPETFSMRKLTPALFLAFSLTLLPAADHVYEEVASAHDLMDYIMKPSMDKLVAINKAGGPQSEKDWKHAKAHGSILAETGQLLLMAGRIKDDVWEKGASRVITGAKESLAAAETMDVNKWRTAAGSIGRGCRGCHKVHKPKEEE